MQNLGAAGEGLQFSSQIAGLAPGTPYHFRAVATNLYGADLGADAVFVTLPAPPVGAVRLDGVDDFVVTPNLTNSFPTKSVTFEIWFRPAGAGVLIDERRQPPPTNGWQASLMEILPSGELKVRAWNLTPVSLGSIAEDGWLTWHHAVLRYDATAMQLDGFLDGVEAASDSAGDRTVPWQFGLPAFYAFGLGDSTHLGGGTFFRGEIGEVRIWNTARAMRMKSGRTSIAA